LDATVFAGTSVGSFNAAVLAMNIDGPAASAKRLTDLWLNTIADQGDGRGNRVYRIRGDVTNYVDFRIPGSPLEQFARVLPGLLNLPVIYSQLAGFGMLPEDWRCGP
jgi:predicted acylesterase/phospholipase RssA